MVTVTVPVPVMVPTTVQGVEMKRYNKNSGSWFEFYSENPTKKEFTESVFPILFSEELNRFAVKICNIIEVVVEKLAEAKAENRKYKKLLKEAEWIVRSLDKERPIELASEINTFLNNEIITKIDKD